MAGWPVPWGGDVLEDTDGASCLLSGRYKSYGVRPSDRSSLAWPDDDAPRSGPTLCLPSRFVHRFGSSALSYVSQLLLFYSPNAGKVNTAIFAPTAYSEVRIRQDEYSQIYEP